MLDRARALLAPLVISRPGRVADTGCVDPGTAQRLGLTPRKWICSFVESVRWRTDSRRREPQTVPTLGMGSRCPRFDSAEEGQCNDACGQPVNLWENDSVLEAL